jgi:non-ribosomal peptide synthetase component F
VLLAGERDHVLDAWQGENLALDTSQCVPELIAGHAVRDSQALAVAHGADTMSYAELDARADQVASRSPRVVCRRAPSSGSAWNGAPS